MRLAQSLLDGYARWCVRMRACMEPITPDRRGVLAVPPITVTRVYRRGVLGAQDMGDHEPGVAPLHLRYRPRRS